MKLLQTLKGHTDRVWSLAWNPAAPPKPFSSSPLAVVTKPFKSTTNPIQFLIIPTLTNTIPQIDY